MNKIIVATLATILSSTSMAESFNTTFHNNHQVTVGTDDFDGSMVRTILELRDKKLDSSEPDQYINTIGYVCGPSATNKGEVHIRAFYTTSHYVYGTQIGGTLGSTMSYKPLQVKFDNSDIIITVPLTQRPSNGLGPELELSEPSLIEKMKASSVMRISDGLGGSSKFNMSGAASAFNAFYKYCK
jgi:hypothetical protein